ncbi:MAG: hypothetical protein LCH52_10220 [Bacteroidetes bacterium]|nr:hypothetical protein [Bacteroidota bacterium]
MRTKTLLLFVFLLTGMAFSQQGGTGRISFKQITQLMELPTQQVIGEVLKEMGNEFSSDSDFKKGDEQFRIVADPATGTATYNEPPATKQRRDEIKSQAIAAGLKVEREQGLRYVRLKGNNYSVVINGDGSIEIKKLK